MNIHEWLPLPTGISTSSHHSFSEDLIKQFDKKCGLILHEDDMISIDQPRSRRTQSCSVHSSNTLSSSSRNDRYRHSSSHLDNVSLPKEAKSRSAAKNVIRKSSLYLRKQLSFKRKKKQAASREITSRPNDEQLSKAAINTTINIPEPNKLQQDIQPPIITQYPPKPLHYSPVEPLSDESHHAGTSKQLHRVSLPLIKLSALHQYNIQKRRSDSDLLNQQPPPSNSVFHSLSKKWNYLLNSCKKHMS